MAGITDSPTRALMERFGIGLTFSEMISAKQLSLSRSNITRRLQKTVCRKDTLFAVQFVGNNPSELSEACKIACDNGADLIDFNLGCPVKKVTKGYGGSALMRDTDLVKRLVESILNSCNIPVTLKCRLGWDETSMTASQIISDAVTLGVSLVSIHARTRCQFFRGRADWKTVRKIKEHCKTPLIINSDILDNSSAKKAIRDSKCDGIMIGRGLMGRPWLIKDLAKSVFHITKKNDQTECIVEIFGEHIESIYSFYGNKIGNLRARKHINWYLKNFLIPTEMKKEILKCDTLDSLKKFFECLKEFPTVKV